MLKRKILTVIFCLVSTTFALPNISTAVDKKEEKNTAYGVEINIAVEELSQELSKDVAEGMEIVVIDFTDYEGNITKFGKFLTEELIAKLSQNKNLTVMEKALFQKTLKERGLSLSDLASSSSMTRAGMLIGIDAVCKGVITDLGEQFKVNVRLIDTFTNEIIASSEVSVVKNEAVLSIMDIKKESFLPAKTPDPLQSEDYLGIKIASVATQLSWDILKEEKKRVAVIGLRNSESKVDELGDYLSDELISKLHQTGKFKLVERKFLDEVLKEQNLGISTIIDPETAVRLGKILGVEAIITGTITDLGEFLRVNARLISAETGAISATATTRIAKEKISVPSVPTLPEKGKPEKEKPVSAGEREGLRGEYFNLAPFNDNPGALPDEPTTVRIDNSIDFDWGEGSPAPNISADYFGVSWEGKLYAPITGTYLFRIAHNDGVRLLIDNKIIIGYWHPYNYNDHKVNLFLEGKQWHQVKVEFFEIAGWAKVELLWRQPGKDDFEVISSSYLKTKGR
ncbi:MAG: FlgO family outer membrane protein [bacterium]|nr:FlgO family outer membrane protein [bacterium]